MLYVLLSWIVIGMSALLWGEAVFPAFAVGNAFSGRKFMLKTLLGLCVLTVYAELFSLFYKVGAAALAGVIFLDAVIILLRRKAIIVSLREWMEERTLWIIPGIGTALLLVLPMAASYINNPDTMLYHAQAIRWIEEYGAVKGLGNLHSRLAFDSSFLCLQALFSFRDIAGQSMHSVNGFVSFVMLAYAVCTMKFWREKRFFISDFLRLGILILLNTMSYDFSSPGTDLFAHLLSLWLFAEWLSLWEENEKKAEPYALLSVLSVYAFTLKLSAAPIVLLAVYPASVLLRGKQWGRILFCLGAGILVLVPFCARNVMLSGYLIYPMEKLDLISADWKMPAEICCYERLRTKAWAEEIFGVMELDAPISAWLPVWKAGQTSGTLRLLCADAAACVINFILGVRRGKRKGDWHALLIGLVASASLLYWFLSAPHVRFGRPVLLIPVLLFSGSIFASIKWKDAAVVSIAVMTFLAAGPLNSLDTSARAEERHWIRCIDYDLCSAEEKQIGEITFYIPEDNDAGYYTFPAIGNRETADSIELRGDSLSDGFRMKE